MSDDKQDPVIDSLLEEFLGDLKAPDLRERILGRAAVQPSARDSNARQQPLADAELATPRVERAPASRARRRKRADWRGWSTVAVTLMIASVLGIFALRRIPEVPSNSGTQFEPIAKIANSNSGPPAPATVPSAAEQNLVDESPKSTFAQSENDSVKPTESPSPTTTPQPARRGLQRPLAPRSPSPTTMVVKTVDDVLRSTWKSAGLQPPPPVGPEVWCRRAYQALVGREPTAEEWKDFSARRSKRELVDAVCASDEFSTHWGQKLARVLVGTHRLPNQANRDQLAKHLSSRLEEGKGYDELVFELLTAEGSAQPEQEDFNAATHFLLALKVNTPDRARAASDVCRLFLGRQVGCAACHDHPLDPTVAQETFWGLSSYLVQTAVERRGVTRLFDVDVPSNSAGPNDVVTFYENPDREVRSAVPTFFGEQASSRSGQLSEIVRREELANRIVNSPDFSRAFVNRMWSQVFGSGLTQPVDDMGPHNPPSHPQLLEGLATEFQASNFDVRELVRWLVLSNAFDRRPVRNDGLIAANDHLFIDFESFAAKRPAPGPAIRGLARAYRAGKSLDDELIGNMMQIDRSVRRQNVPPPAVARFRRLNSMNRAMVRRLAASEKLTNAEKVEHLFEAILGRQPFERERREAVAIFDGQAAAARALEELATTLINTEEASVEH